MGIVRFGIYANVNMNLIDGSSIWLQSLIETLAGLPGTEVTLLLKAPEDRYTLTGPLHELGNVQVVAPPRERLGIGETIKFLIDLDRKTSFDAIVLRGIRHCEEAAKKAELAGRLWCYLTEIPHDHAEITQSIQDSLQKIADASEYLLCQTDALRGHIEAACEAARGKALLLPPMVPSTYSAAPKTIGNLDRVRIVYAGKFAPLWGTLEMIGAFERFHLQDPIAEFHVFGDKVHNPPEQPDFNPAVTQKLTSTPGLIWHRGLPRDDVLARLPGMTMAWAWRLNEIEASTLELSTKVLEYGNAGLPVILNRNNINEHLLGVNYPLFAGSLVEATEQLFDLRRRPVIFERAAQICFRAAQQHTFDKVRDRSLHAPYQYIQERHRIKEKNRGKTVLFAGHDFKFIRDFIDHMRRTPGIEVLVDQWEGHAKHDPKKSESLLQRADAVFCEWALGNAEWYSKNLGNNQRLVVRAHLQEFGVNSFNDIVAENIDCFVFISPYLLNQAQEKFGLPTEKLRYIPINVDTLQFDRSKLPGSKFNIGIVGICPARKRFDMALSVLEHLAWEDERYTLHVKGRWPWEYQWLWRNSEEREHYEEQFDRIRRTQLNDRVIFDGFDNDVPTWFRGISFLLSTSDFEGCHTAVAEAAGSGAVPRLLEWAGANQLYHPDWVFQTPEEIAQSIDKVVREERVEEVGGQAKDFVHTHFDRAQVFEALSAELFE